MTLELDDVGFQETKVIEVPTDRCDARFANRESCGAKAYVFARFKVGSLAYCSHHGTEYWDQLTLQAWSVLDLRYSVLQ